MNADAVRTCSAAATGAGFPPSGGEPMAEGASIPSVGQGSDQHDWKAEASGLAHMICEIRDRYLWAKEHTGGDSELLASSIFNAYSWVDGPLREIWDAELNDGEVGR